MTGLSQRQSLLHFSVVLSIAACATCLWAAHREPDDCTVWCSDCRAVYGYIDYGSEDEEDSEFGALATEIQYYEETQGVKIYVHYANAELFRGLGNKIRTNGCNSDPYKPENQTGFGWTDELNGELVCTDKNMKGYYETTTDYSPTLKAWNKNLTDRWYCAGGANK